MKKFVISVFAAVVITASMVLPASAILASENNYCVFSLVDQNCLSNCYSSWSYFRFVYIDAKESGDEAAMKAAQDNMNKAHAIAITVRSKYGDRIESVNSQVFQTSDDGSCFALITMATSDYNMAYYSFIEGNISYEQMKSIQSEALKILDAVTADYGTCAYKIVDENE